VGSTFFWPEDTRKASRNRAGEVDGGGGGRPFTTTHDSRLRRQDSGLIEYTQRQQDDSTTPHQNRKDAETALPFTELGYFK